MVVNESGSDKADPKSEKEEGADEKGYVDDGQGPGLPESEPKKEEDGAEPPKEETPKEEPKEEPEKEAWDKARQQRDQEHAAKVKELQADVKTAEDQIDRLLQALAPDAKRDATDEVADMLGEDADLDDVAKEVKRLAAKNKDALAKIGDLEKRISDRDAQDAEERDQRRAVEAEAMLDATLDALDKKYSPSYRGEAFKKAKATLAELGFDDGDNAPPNEATILALNLAYKEVHEDKRPAASKDEGSRVPLDPGTGGRAASVKRQEHMTLEEARASMKKEGKL